MISLIGIYPSNTKNKKYVALFDLGNNKIKRVNFGSKKSSTYLDHNDPIKRENYIARHTALGTEDFNDPLTAGSLSMHILWGVYPDLEMNINNFKQMFKL